MQIEKKRLKEKWQSGHPWRKQCLDDAQEAVNTANVALKLSVQREAELRQKLANLQKKLAINEDERAAHMKAKQKSLKRLQRLQVTFFNIYY